MPASGTLEAEYVALSEVVKEVIFLRQVQEFMEPSMRVGAVNVSKTMRGPSSWPQTSMLAVGLGTLM